MFFCSCSKVFLVPSENVIREKTGCLLFAPGYAAEFIPLKIDTGLNIADNLGKNKIGKGFYLYSMRNSEKAFIMLYKDSISHKYAIPVKLYYTKEIETNKQLKKDHKKVDMHLLRINGKEIEYKVQRGNYDEIHVVPYISLKKRLSIKDPNDSEN